MNCRLRCIQPTFRLPASLGIVVGALLLLSIRTSVQAEDSSRESSRNNSSKVVISREYSLEDRIRYQLWDYSWNPNPDEPITRIQINLAQQRVYVYQGDSLAAQSPISTGKPGYDTPAGHFTILAKDIDHKSNKYGVFLDSQGNVVNGNAAVDMTAPHGSVYDAADMPYYLRLKDDGVGMHAGYLPGYAESHGCIHLPQAFAELLFSNVSVGTPVDIVQ